MKILYFFLCLNAVLYLSTSCTEKDLYQPKDPETGNTDDFTFQTKEDVTIRVTAIDGNRNKVAEAPFYFYAESPYDKAGEWLKPSVLFYGVTGENGLLEARFTIPNGLKILYVYTPQFGFLQTYDIQNGNKTMTFQVPAFEYMPETKASLTKADEVYPSIAIHPNPDKGAFFQVYTFYEGAQDTYNGEPAYTVNGNENMYGRPVANVSLSDKGAPLIGYKGLVTKEEDVSSIAQEAHILFPEKGLGFKEENRYLLEEQNSTDLVVKADYGAEVYATYLSDGGFYTENEETCYNTLCYFHYTGSAPDPATVKKTVLFPNTDPRSIPQGTKVQLLYWNGTKYVKNFPKGTKIGWCYIQNAYGKRDNAPGNPNRFSDFRMRDLQYYRFSLASMNSPARKIYGLPATPTYNQAIGLWSEKNQCTIVGIENRWAFSKDKYGVLADDDFNDVLIAVTSTPTIKPEHDINDPLHPDGEEMEIKSEQSGTLAFEDMHPNIGDYDHNDVVIDYTYSLIKNASAELISLEATFLPRAAGGTRSVGFGIEFPQINTSNIREVQGATWEKDCTTPVTIVYDEVHECFGAGLKGKIINTYPPGNQYSAKATTVRVNLSKPLPASVSNEITVLKFNPFIFVDSRENETHLIDYRPTSKNNNKTFGTVEDQSDGIKTFYRTSDGHAWALDITKASPAETSWLYPIEGTSIIDAYPGYIEWAQGDHTQTNWFQRKNGVAKYLCIPSQE
ncbi:LruC domain-containing protein [Parabacteroides pacaensis]|uniref:LruC domain-containing protein n=1 Tax=Parabacteroides pacaensis TaxID=2086575 RepID=UPI000D0FB8BB|nr:LruC domain-containing protein [Parabacteroides pacaensis]